MKRATAAVGGLVLVLMATACGPDRAQQLQGQPTTTQSRAATGSSGCPFTAIDMSRALSEPIDVIPGIENKCQFNSRSTTVVGPIAVYRNDGDLPAKRAEVIGAGFSQIVDEPRIGPGCFRGTQRTQYPVSATYTVCNGWEWSIILKGNQTARIDQASKYLAAVY